MGDEADALEGQYGYEDEIARDERERDFYAAQEQKAFQRKVDTAVKKALKGKVRGKKKPYSKGKMVTVKCESCNNDFEARVADRKRGWAKFCSKSCKAKKQESKTHRYRTYMNKGPSWHERREREDAGY
jgi:hypothetical protein